MQCLLGETKKKHEKGKKKNAARISRGFHLSVLVRLRFFVYVCFFMVAFSFFFFFCAEAWNGYTHRQRVRTVARANPINVITRRICNSGWENKRTKNAKGRKRNEIVPRGFRPRRVCVRVRLCLCVLFDIMLCYFKYQHFQGVPLGIFPGEISPGIITGTGKISNP